MNKVITNIKRVDKETIKGLEVCGVSTIHEAQGRKGLLADHLRPIYQGTRIAGSALTISVPPCDNWMIHVAVEQCQPGDIMVIAPTSFSDAGYFGDLLGASLKANGVTGVVLDGGCRDVAVLKAAGFPVWSKAISAQGTVKETLGDVNVPIVCGGQIVSPGDVIIADDDGVVVVPRDAAADIAAKSAAREAREDQIRLRYEAGELGIDMNNMRPRMAEKGLIYRDQD